MICEARFREELVNKALYAMVATEACNEFWCELAREEIQSRLGSSFYWVIL